MNFFSISAMRDRSFAVSLQQGNFAGGLLNKFLCGKRFGAVAFVIRVARIFPPKLARLELVIPCVALAFAQLLRLRYCYVPSQTFSVSISASMSVSLQIL